jgi:hypothetical protein
MKERTGRCKLIYYEDDFDFASESLMMDDVFSFMIE